MKKFALALVVLSSSAFADVPEIKAWKTTCQDIKNQLENYGTVTVTYKKALVFHKRLHIQKEASCTGSYEYLQHAYFKTTDMKQCQVGQFCEYNPPAPSYSSSDYSYSSSSSDNSYSSGSSDYSSGSSSSGSSRGDNYNPPSSGTRGESYDPPSSGTRGSRYCPGC